MRAVLHAVFAAFCATGSAAAALSDEQLRAQIAGVWYCEDMQEVTKHAAGRLQYFPDGRFIADYRVSGPGNEHYIRTLGTWKVAGGLFTESVSKHSDPKQSFGTLVRRVIAIDKRRMILGPADGGSARFEIWRGKTKLDDSEGSMASIQKKLLTDLESMHISGFRPIPAGNGMVSWRLDSRKIQTAINSEKKK
jgi:hypothetical protein